MKIPVFLPALAWSLAGLLLLPLSSPAQTTEFGGLNVVQVDSANTNASVTLSKTTGCSPNVTVGDGNRGDYNVDFYAAGLDGLSGAVIPCISQLSRDNTAQGDTIGRFYATAAFGPDEAASDYTLAVFAAPAGGEVNINVAFGFFPFNRWLGGVARNTTNNGELTELTGTSSLVVGTHFVEAASPAGQYTLSINGLTGNNASQNGILLVAGAKNEANFALSKANADGTFTIFCHDNGTDSTNYENDSVSFAYLPVSKVGTDRLVAMGRVNGNASLDISANAPGKTITVTKGGTGIWYLQIAGQTDSNGTLLISAEGGTGNNIDNIVSYGWESANNRWAIESRDLPAATPGLQNAQNAADDVFSFAYFSAPILPAVTLTSPTAGATGVANASFNLAATASDSDGSIAEVQFLRNGVVIATDTSSPYTFTDSALPAGHYDYQARAVDNEGYTTTTAVSQVTVTMNPASIPANTALSFDGTNDFVTAGAAPTLNVGQLSDAGFTLECWFRREGTGLLSNSGSGGVSAVAPLFGKGRGESDGTNVDCNIFFGVNSAGLLAADFEAYPATGIAAGENFPFTATNEPVTNNVWHHAAVTYDHATSTWQMYLDGINVGSKTVTSGARPRYDCIQHFAIGAALNSTGTRDGAFRGRIDEARVWNYARSAAEIAATKDQAVTSATGLIGRFGLNEGTGTSTVSPAGSHTGTLTNGPLWVEGIPFGVPNAFPSVVLSQPVSESTVTLPGAVTIVATASDSDGPVTKVEFLVDGVKVAEDTTTPYSYAWTPPSKGNYAISARVLDAWGASATSNIAMVQVLANANQPGISLASPANNAPVTGSSTVLQATVSDPNNDAMTVTFYGRLTTPAAPGPDFSLVQIPDTQFYSQGSPARANTITVEQLKGTFGAQTQWVVDNRLARNIAFVSHMGDIVQNGNNNGDPSEWELASAAMGRLENPATTLLAHGVPFGAAPGNHDMDPIGDYDAGSKAFYNRYFGYDRYAGRGYYGGHFGTDNTNNYEFFSASGLDFMVIQFAYDTSPNQAILDWGDALMKAHPHRRVIVSSHSIIGGGNPATFSSQGQALYDAFKDNPNFFLMLCGHIHAEGRRADAFEGRTVYSILSDYQGASNGGNGFLRLHTFSPATNTIKIESYSPTLGRPVQSVDAIPSWEPLVTLPYNMQQSVMPWVPLGTANVTAGGTSATLNWTGLEAGKTYEWYASVSDGTNLGSSVIRRFTTPAGTPPSVALDAPADGAPYTTPTTVHLAATASDADGSVSRVEFYSGSIKLGEDTTAPYAFDWTGMPGGTYTLTAVAVDNNGLAGLSNASTIVITQGDLFPSVALTSPADGAELSAPGNFTLTASASDAEGAVVKVEFLTGVTSLTSLGEDTAAPFALPLNNLAPGGYTFVARATDSAGQVTTSAPVRINVTVEAGSPTAATLSAGAFDPPSWTVTQTSSSPRHFNQPGTNPGDLALKIAGASVAFNAGVVLATNWNSPATVAANLSSNDNLATPYADASGNVSVSVLDNSNNNQPTDNPSTTEQTSGISVVYFPYSGGWTGASISSAGAVISGNLPAGVTISKAFYPGAYVVNGLSTAGNLFAVPNGNNGGQADNVLAVRIENGRWTVSVRDNEGQGQDGSFTFLYVPPQSTGVFAAAVSRTGIVSSMNASLASLGATTVTSASGIDITIGDGSVVNPSTALLLVSTDTTADGQNGVSADNLVAWSANGNSFHVFSQDLPDINGTHEPIDMRILVVPFAPVATPAAVVTITAADASAGEHGADQAFNFTISRTGSTTSSLTVPLISAGTATAGTDYTGFLSSIVIPAAQSSVNLPLAVQPDNAAEGAETVRINIGASAAYTIGTPAFATASIADQPAQDWYFGNISDPSRRGPVDDADGDGLPNLLEYYMGTHPQNRLSGEGTSVTAPSQASAIFHFRKALTHNDVGAVVEWSPDLVQWYRSGQTDGFNTINITVGTNSQPSDDPQLMEATATNAAGGALPPGIFFRLNVGG